MISAVCFGIGGQSRSHAMQGFPLIKRWLFLNNTVGDGAINTGSNFLDHGT